MTDFEKEVLEYIRWRKKDALKVNRSFVLLYVFAGIVVFLAVQIGRAHV